MIVRAATSDDVDAICAVCAVGYRDSTTGLLPAGYIERTVADFYQPDRVRDEIYPNPPGWLGYQVVEEDGRVLGAAGGGMTGHSSSGLYVICVDPAERYRGLGTRLLDRVIDQVRELGATEMLMSVIIGNGKAIPFYESRGFTKVEKQRAWGSHDGDDVWTWRMRRVLAG
jgi:ribosomal protein S18 acetylase RimI-like enzyme